MMEGNIGWKYNKAYFYNLRGDTSNGAILKNQNEELLKIVYDSSSLGQLLDVWKDIVPGGNFFTIELTTSYPGLITGIGINHQTTLKWMFETEGKPIQIPEFKFGMMFDYTTGLPIIPGSSIKGVLRSFFPIMNQNKFCDCYHEKIDYIAAILHKVHQLFVCVKNQEKEEEKLVNDLLLNEYLLKENQSKEKLLELFKKQREDEIEEMIGMISEDEFDELSSSQALITFAEKHLKSEMESFYQSFNRDKKKDLRKKAEKLYKEKINAILYQPLEEEEINEEDKIKASCLALEMFEGKKNEECIPIYQRDTFFDAIPVSGDSRADGLLFAKDYIAPHKNLFKDPEPICFMKIRSNVKFMFSFILHDGIVSKEEKLMLIKYLLYKNGLGAKTNVGYGQFNSSEKEILKITK